MAEESGFLKALRSVLDRRKPYVPSTFRTRVWLGDQEITDIARFEAWRSHRERREDEDDA